MQLPRPGSSVHCAKPGSAGQSAVTFAAAACHAEAQGAAMQTRCRLACLPNPRCICWRAAADAKYDSGTGWPSFWKPLDPEHVIEVTDNSIPFMVRLLVPVLRMGHQRQWLAAMPPAGGWGFTTPWAEQRQASSPAISCSILPRVGMRSCAPAPAACLLQPRVEVLCARSGAHLGHVFTGGCGCSAMISCRAKQ